MSQDNESNNLDEQKRQVEPAEAGLEEKDSGTKSAEARIWAAANKLTSEGEEPSQEQQKSI